ncbi:MAG: hypothetical protein ACJ790_05975 [Myxococcaceae bacterium]
MALPLTFAFDALADFISRTTDPSAVPGAAIAPAVTFQDETHQRDNDVRQAEANARASRDTALQAFLQDLRKAIADPARADPDTRAQIARQLEEQKRQLLQGDGFGTRRKDLPPEIDRALQFIKTNDPAAAPPEVAGDDDLEIDPEVLAELSALGSDDPFLVEFEEHDPEAGRIRDFVQRYFSEGFEDHRPRDASKPLDQQQPQTQRNEPRVVGDSSLQLVSAQMEPAEKRAFIQLKPEQRGQYLAMNADEKSFVRQLQPDEREHYFTLNPDSREQFRKLAPEVRTQRGQETKKAQAAAAKTPPEELSKSIAQNLMKALDISAARDPELREKAMTLAWNFVTSTNGDRAKAEMGTLKALLADPQISQPLMDDLQETLEEATSPAARAYSETDPVKKEEKSSSPEDGELKKKLKKGAGNYGAHFQRIRHTLPQLAQQLVQPGLTRKNLLDGMKKAVIVSADYLVNYPKRAGGSAQKSGGGAPMGFKHRTIAG